MVSIILALRFAARKRTALKAKNSSQKGRGVETRSQCCGDQSCRLVSTVQLSPVRDSRKSLLLKMLLISGWVGAAALQLHRISPEDRHFLPKPFRYNELVLRVREVLASDEPASWPGTGVAGIPLPPGGSGRFDRCRDWRSLPLNACSCRCRGVKYAGAISGTRGFVTNALQNESAASAALAERPVDRCSAY